MTQTEKTIYDGQYSYREFNFIVKIIQKEWGLEGEGLHNDLSISGSKFYLDPVNNKNQLMDELLKNMVDNIKESLRVYADYEKSTRKAPRRRSYRRYPPRPKIEATSI